MFEDLINKLKKSNTNNYEISLGFDGYVDEIIKPVDSRESIDKFTQINSIPQLGNRILNAAGKSTNIELVTEKFKLGGNGPILGNSIANMGIKVDYIGALGIPTINNVFNNLNPLFKMTSIDNPGHTMALEFEDGKIMFGRLAMTDLTWQRLTERTESDHLKSFFTNKNLIGMVNWTQTPYMSEIWDILLENMLPKWNLQENKKPFLFIDLADPQKRSKEDITYMLKQLTKFQNFYHVILGLNEKESYEISNVLNLTYDQNDIDHLKTIALKIKNSLNIFCTVIHPVKYAVCAIDDLSFRENGPYCEKPLISTGAGDHFNAGFCLGMILNLTPSECLILGTANSGFYVRNAKSANMNEIIGFLNDWQKNKI